MGGNDRRWKLVQLDVRKVPNKKRVALLVNLCASQGTEPDNLGKTTPRNHRRPSLAGNNRWGLDQGVGFTKAVVAEADPRKKAARKNCDRWPHQDQHSHVPIFKFHLQSRRRGSYLAWRRFQGHRNQIWIPSSKSKTKKSVWAWRQELKGHQG